MRPFPRCVVILLIVLQCCLLWSTSLNAKELLSHGVVFQDSLEWADYYYNIHRYKQAIPLYRKNLDTIPAEKAKILKKLATRHMLLLQKLVVT